MTTKMSDLLDRLQNTTTLDDVQTLIAELRDIYGLTHVVYHVVGNSGREYGAFTYSKEWVAHYVEREYFRVDPVVTESMRRFHPLDWRTLDWTPRPARKLMLDAQANGIGKHGLSVPIRDVGGQFALFSVTSGGSDAGWDDFLLANSRDILLAAHFVHERVSQIVGEDRDIVGRQLSPREKDALTLLATGQSRAAAAERLRISEHTFRVYVDTARHKLGALNTTHAVAMALSGGLILP